MMRSAVVIIGPAVHMPIYPFLAQKTEKIDKTTPVLCGAREISPVKLHIRITAPVTHLFHEITRFRI